MSKPKTAPFQSVTIWRAGLSEHDDGRSRAGFINIMNDKGEMPTGVSKVVCKPVTQRELRTVIPRLTVVE